MSTPEEQTTQAGRVVLRYWASARAAAGVDSDVMEVDGPTSLADLKRRARALHADSDRFADVLACCSVMVGDRPVTTDDAETVVVHDGDSIEFLPPFAGG